MVILPLLFALPVTRPGHTECRGRARKLSELQVQVELETRLMNGK